LAENQSEGIIGRRFKPKIVFKENEMQTLFDKAEPPVQQVIEKILIDELDQFHNFSYASHSKTMKRRANTKE